MELAFQHLTQHYGCVFCRRLAKVKIFRRGRKRGSAKNGADAVVAWLKSNVRDFTYETVTWPMSYTENFQPIREGFSWHMDVGHLEPRYHGLKQLIDSRSPDGVVVGMSLENTSHDCGYGVFRSHIETEGVDIYFAGSRDFSPVPKGASFNWDVVAPPCPVGLNNGLRCLVIFQP